MRKVTVIKICDCCGKALTNRVIVQTLHGKDYDLCDDCNERVIRNMDYMIDCMLTGEYCELDFIGSGFVNKSGRAYLKGIKTTKRGVKCTGSK